MNKIGGFNYELNDKNIFKDFGGAISQDPYEG